MQNQNKVTLIGYYGGDKTHALSAWQSTGIEFDYTKNINSRTDFLFEATAKEKKKSMPDLLEMLAKAQHHSPFEKSTLHFQITADIATHIQCLKHRIGVSINSSSARYREQTDQWYLPDDWNDHDVVWLSNCQKESEWTERDDAYSYVDRGDTWLDALNHYVSLGHELYHVAVEQLTPHLGRKRAKESARYFLPYAKQLDFDMMFNFRSFMHFQGLRNSEHAQVEIQAIAESMLEQVKAIPGDPFKYSLEAFAND